MFNFISKNSKVIPEKNLIKVKYNNGKCPYCNNEKIITNDGGSLSECLKCYKKFTLFKYIDETSIKKDNYNDFLNKNSNIDRNAFI